MIAPKAGKRMFPNQMRYQAAPLPDCVPPRDNSPERQGERQAAALSGVTLSRCLSRGVRAAFPFAAWARPMTLPHYIRTLLRRYWQAVRDPLPADVRDEYGL